jgi:hypothetical protein
LAGPPNSLLWLDACNLGDEAALRAVPGLNTARRERSEGGWFCSWGRDPALADPPYTEISIYRSQPLTGQTTLIGGRSATVNKRSGTCEVVLAQRTFQGVFGESRVETLYVNVHLIGSTPEAQCDAATKVAEAAAAKLPPPN